MSGKTFTNSTTIQEEAEYSQPAKRRRTSTGRKAGPGMLVEIPDDINSFRKNGNGGMADSRGHSHDDVEGDEHIAIASTGKHAEQTVAPFLARHVPDQYAPLGGHIQVKSSEPKGPNSKFCYRHQPDLKCRRQADEPSMDQLQRELESLSQADQGAIANVWSVFSAAPAKQRNLILQGVLAQCCFPQLSYLSANIRDLIKIDFLSALPAEISFKILCYLDTTSLCKAAQVSQRWRILADDDVVWHRMCEQHIDRKCTKCGWGLPLLERKRLRASKRQIQLRATGRGMNEWSPDITPMPEDFIGTNSSFEEKQLPTNGHGRASSPLHIPIIPSKRCAPSSSNPKDIDESYFKKTRPWKDVYKDRFKVGTNWKYGRCTTKIFKGHTNGIMCLQFDDTILATGSYDGTIKLWDVDTGEELRTLRGHESGIRCLQFDDTKLISGSIDRSLKVWNWRTGECISTYTGHSAGVIGLHFDSTILASASIDRTIKIWNFEDKSTFLLRGHTDWVNAVKLDSPSRTVFSASDDCTVRLWDLDTKCCIRTFEGHVGQVQQVLPLPREFELEDVDTDADTSSTVSNDPELHYHNLSPSSPPSTSNPSRPSPPKYMLTSALDSTIRLWEVSTGRCLRTFFGHVEGVWALAADTLRVVSGAEDRMVKVWDPRTGKCDRTFTGHAGPVTCVGLSDSRMCTGSEDCDVRMYTFRE